MNNHIVICGFGATGASAAADLRSRGREVGSIVVVDIDPIAIEHANSLGYVGIVGDATTTAVLRDAMIERADGVIVAPNRDDTAVLITLTARELNPTATIVAGGREQENLHLLQQGGADHVIDATAAVGRMLGLAMEAPGAVRAFDDMIDAGSGLELVEGGPEDIDNGGTLVAIERDGKRLPPEQVSRDQIQPGDRLVIVRESGR